MVVFSPLALYTTYLGWQQYDVVFMALCQTGLIYLGFVGLAYRFLKNVLAPGGSTHHAAEYAMNHFIYELAITFLICAFFVYPCVPLETRALEFKPLCTSQAMTARIGQSGTQYDEAFADVLAHDVKLPIGFALIQNFISSLSYALMKVTACTDSLQAIDGDIVSMNLPRDLHHQAMDFHQQCYLSAKTKLDAEAKPPASLKSLLKRYGGEDDLNWIGSHVLQSLYYQDLTARHPIKGFSFAQSPKESLQKALARGDIDVSQLPINGYPSCQQWWGRLEDDLVSFAEHASIFNPYLEEPALLARLEHYRYSHPKAWKADISAQDYIARKLLTARADLQTRSAKALMGLSHQSFSQGLSHGLVNIGQWAKSWTTTPLKREAIMQTLPIMHAFFFFFLVILTPLVLCLSQYHPKALGSLCGLFVMSLLLQYLWYLVGFLEQAVLDPLKGNDIIAAMKNVVVLFYFIAPLVLLKLSSHFGGEAGNSLMGLIRDGDVESSHSAQAAHRAANVASRVMGGVIR